ncbi:MAG: hypothetical protein CL943_04075 [Candidatus Diapherotrites archaeon]|uniref:Type II toxin-antitoxin system RelE/ParE family toxin n=1 Tax=Candidatus Iainarchaeum sp. TaxID=3101447 RepID=A0A2D6M227_9ARCH|nr:hypothetical protein [Candidatus Diapherotrites archaeon]|tara:strand:- start:4567 stop:4908 length:342 start_codon:yes stop_codon:yes gene_type:complete
MNEIRFSKEFSKDFSKLQNKAEKGKSEAEYLLRIVDRGIAKLASDLEAGKKIPGRLWPKEYAKEHDLRNLWKLNLDSYWRMLYTVVGNEAKIVGIVLDVLDHKKYSRKFGYKK